MAVSVQLVKRDSKKTQRMTANIAGRCGGTIRRPASETPAKARPRPYPTAAESMQKIKWAEVNLLAPARELEETEPEEAPRLPWGVSRDALERAMRADNLRPSYVNDALLMFDGLHRMFPELQSPADMTSDLANEYKRRRAEGDPERGIARRSPWTINGDLSTLKAIFGKWLGRECGLLVDNPFANISGRSAIDPQCRVSADEMAVCSAGSAPMEQLATDPMAYFRTAVIRLRATEIASLGDEVLAPRWVRGLDPRGGIQNPP